MTKTLMTTLENIHHTLTVPGDKSISHRAIMLGSIANGLTTVTGFLRADDCLSTIKIMRQLGVKITDDGHQITIEGKGIEGLQAPEESLDAGNSGTTMRLLSGLLAGQPFQSVLTGDASLSKRPMGRVMNPLASMGADIKGHEGTELPPLTINPVKKLTAIDYIMPVASAQVKSAILLAGLQAEGTTTITEKEVSRNHTEEMLEQFGATIQVVDNVISLQGGQSLTGQAIDVPGDISSAAFFIVAGLILPNSRIELKNVGINETRSGIIEVIQAMGGNITVNQHPNGYSADIIIESSQLKATEVSGSIIPRLIDEIPLIALLATQAEGTTIIKDAQELRVKETDRIEATASELRKMKAKIQETEDGLSIEGRTPLRGAHVDSFGDHRIGMMLQIAGLIIPNGDQLLLEDADCVNISYPTFFEEIDNMAHKSTLIK